MAANDPSGLDDLDPAVLDFRDAGPFRRLVAAREAVDVAEREVRAAVLAARRAGDSWSVIGAALGVSRQAAFKRFAVTDRASAVRGG